MPSRADLNRARLPRRISSRDGRERFLDPAANPTRRRQRYGTNSCVSYTRGFQAKNKVRASGGTREAGRIPGNLKNQPKMGQFSI
jgi:hypothetical protein